MNSTVSYRTMSPSDQYVDVDMNRSDVLDKEYGQVQV